PVSEQDSLCRPADLSSHSEDKRMMRIFLRWVPKRLSGWDRKILIHRNGFVPFGQNNELRDS
ncbi:MAG: hypothetical protein PVJ84_04070, partial [Desulfobacteraceae bacterium]